MSYPNSAVAHAKASITTIARPAPARQPRPSADWPAHALSAYYYAQRQALAALPKLLATRVSALTDRTINPEDLFVDYDAELAVVVVDGVVFRAHDGQVTILRTCVECGIERFKSAPLFSRADLGYALSAWQPRCRGCQEEDPANWLES
jgi:hypothetical protein